MSYGKKPSSYSSHPTYGRTGPPSWLIFLLGVAMVFAVYYVWMGFRNFMESGGLGVLESTQQAQEEVTATAEQIQLQQAAITPLPSITPLPECQDFIVIAEPSAIVRAGPTTASEPMDTWVTGELVCIIEREGNTDWFQVDLNPHTRHIEIAYIREDLIEAVNPTPTPSNTPTPAPTVTPIPTNTPTLTFTPAPTRTPDPDATHIPSPTPTPSATPAIRSL